MCLICYVQRYWLIKEQIQQVEGGETGSPQKIDNGKRPAVLGEGEIGSPQKIGSGKRPAVVGTVGLSRSPAMLLP